MYTVYGIPNCDTVKKSINWLTEHKISFIFHNYKKLGITPQKLKKWSAQIGWESIVNKKGSTWRNLGEKIQATITNEKKAISLLTENTSAIKRPIIEKGDIIITLGFDEEVYTKVFNT